MPAQEKNAQNREQYGQVERQDYDQGEECSGNLSATPFQRIVHIAHHLSPLQLQFDYIHSWRSNQEFLRSTLYYEPRRDLRGLVVKSSVHKLTMPFLQREQGPELPIVITRARFVLGD